MIEYAIKKHIDNVGMCNFLKVVAVKIEGYFRNGSYEYKK